MVRALIDLTEEFEARSSEQRADLFPFPRIASALQWDHGHFVDVPQRLRCVTRTVYYENIKAQVIAVKECDGDAFLQPRAQTGTASVK
jgi:hypothetical protein